ncbi:MAG: retroviral-like aspartic protease family protein [Candidatus Cloacimonetes bacterium]|nr:retroviral-like aspartic protease family protein [Candidatus Cloacimonadota bacterium]
MDVVKFPYEDAGEGFFGQIFRPLAKVTLSTPMVTKSPVNIWMVVDTGADYTIIPRHFSEKLRISLEHDCMKDETFGVGGRQTIYFYKSRVEAKIGGFRRKIPLAFFDNNEIPALLGRLDFLETFDTEFLKSHFVIFRD